MARVTERMKKFMAIPLIAGVLIGALLGLPLLIGIWLPDVIFPSSNTLADLRFVSGHSFRVIQYWNRCDFYNTELLHTLPDGSVTTNVLDADDAKSWSVPLIVDEQQRTATIILRGNRVKKVSW